MSLAFMRILRDRFNLALLCGCVFVALACWLASGTMSPYALTVEQPKVLPPCGYLANPDHPHFEATFAMLDGQPRERWEFSVMLRRILFPLLAFGLMKAFGFLAGGLVTSILIQIAALVIASIYARRQFGELAGFAMIALLATYPGTYYWAGLPYPHVTIVPASIVSTILLREIERAKSCRRIAILSAVLGVLMTAYDLAPFFVPALVLILLIRRRFGMAIVATIIAIAPMAIVAVLLRFVAHVELLNQNTLPYSVILHTYFHHDVTFAAWMKHISIWPLELVKTYFWSNFVFIPGLFLIVLSWHGFSTHVLKAKTRVENLCHGRAELWILLSGLAVFLFNNLAPPYRGWQFHGEGVARIYQPLIGAMLLLIVANVARSPRPWLIGLLAGVCLVNASIALGPVTRNPLAAWVDHKFYQHAPSPQMLVNLDRYGRRPLGFCGGEKRAKVRKKKSRGSARSAISSAPAPSRDG